MFLRRPPSTHPVRVRAERHHDGRLFDTALASSKLPRTHGPPEPCAEPGTRRCITNGKRPEPMEAVALADQTADSSVVAFGSPGEPGLRRADRRRLR